MNRPKIQIQSLDNLSRNQKSLLTKLSETELDQIKGGSCLLHAVEGVTLNGSLDEAGIAVVTSRWPNPC